MVMSLWSHFFGPPCTSVNRGECLLAHVFVFSTAFTVFIVLAVCLSLVILTAASWWNYRQFVYCEGQDEYEMTFWGCCMDEKPVTHHQSPFCDASDHHKKTQSLNEQDFFIRAMYTVSQKKHDTKLLPITSPNVNQFSKFFHWQTHL